MERKSSCGIYPCLVILHYFSQIVITKTKLSLFFHLNNHQLLMFHEMMASPKELPFTKPTTDFKLCLYCQTGTGENLVHTQSRTFKESTFETFLKCVQKKADYYNPEFVWVGQRLLELQQTSFKLRKLLDTEIDIKKPSHLDKAESPG